MHHCSSEEQLAAKVEAITRVNIQVSSAQVHVHRVALRQPLDGLAKHGVVAVPSSMMLIAPLQVCTVLADVQVDIASVVGRGLPVELVGAGAGGGEDAAGQVHPAAHRDGEGVILDCGHGCHMSPRRPECLKLDGGQHGRLQAGRVDGLGEVAEYGLERRTFPGADTARHLHNFRVEVLKSVMATEQPCSKYCGMTARKNVDLPGKT